MGVNNRDGFQGPSAQHMLANVFSLLVLIGGHPPLNWDSLGSIFNGFECSTPSCYKNPLVGIQQSVISLTSQL